MRAGPALAAIAAMLTFTIDRFEPPMAVLIDHAGQTHDVPLSTLPPEARPGDRLASPTGPVIDDRAARAAALRARLDRLVRIGRGPDARESIPGASPATDDAQ